MSNQIKLFNNILTEFDNADILDEFVLVGSWCQHVYKRSEEYNYMMHQTSTLTTMDIDLLIPDKNKVKMEADVPAILKKLDFIEDPKNNGLIKYGNSELGVDFLTELKGKAQKDVIEIEKLKVNAEPLRYMDILSNNKIKVHFDNFEFNVPEPAAFVLNKFIASYKRKNKEKRAKDIKTAIEYYNILIK